MIFFILFICTSTTAAFVYRLVFNHSLDQSQKNNHQLIDKASKYIDTQMEQIYKLQIHAAWLQSLENAIESGEEDIRKSYFDLSTDLYNMSRKLPYIHNIYVYDKHKDLVITADYSNYKSQYYFTTVERHYQFDYPQHINIISSHNLFAKLPSSSLFSFGERIEVLSFVTSYPLNEEPAASIVINIDKNKLMKALIKDLSPSGASFLVLDVGGKILLTNGDITSFDDYSYNIIREYFLSNNKMSEIEIGEKNYKVVYAKSAEPEWLYAVLIPISSYNSAYAVKLVFICTGILALLIILALLSAHLTNRAYSPVAAAVGLIQSHINKGEFVIHKAYMKNELHFIYEGVKSIAQKNSCCEDLLDRYKPLIEEKIIRSILYDDCCHSADGTDMELLTASMPYPYFMALLWEFDNYQLLEQKMSSEGQADLRNSITGYIKKALASSFKVQYINLIGRRVLIIINSNRDTLLTELLEIIKAAKRGTSLAGGITYSIGLGSFYEGIENIKKSYEEAVIALNQKFVKGKDSIICIDDIVDNVYQSQDNYCCYSFAHEQKLINLVNTGSAGECLQLVEEILEITLAKEHTKQDMQLLAAQLIGTILRAIKQSNIEYHDVFDKKFNIYKDLSNYETSSDMKRFIFEQYGRVCSYIRRMREKVGQSPYAILAEKMVEYIENNYQKDISLKELSDIHQYSPSYLSIAFKEHLGENFVDYINKYRLKHAKKMLKATDWPINQISEKVGYHSDNSFIRIFKKYEGITPGQYRDQCAG